MKAFRNTYQKLSVLQLNRAILCAGVTTVLFGMSALGADSAEPFQILETDLATVKPVRPTAPQPFMMLTSDVAVGRTTIYQGNESAGDAEITNNTDETVYFNDQSTADAAIIINNTGGATHFNDQSTAANAFITNNADAALTFNQHSTAKDARITNNNNGNLVFNDTASAGDAVITNNGRTSFNDTASADNALITNNASGSINFNDQSDAGKRNIYNSGQIQFADNSSANESLIDNNKTGSIHFAGNSTSANANINNSGRLAFSDNSTADHAAIINNETGSITFSGQSDAANATITNSGSTLFSGESSAKDARLINNADANLRFQDQSSAGSSFIVNAGDLVFSGSSSAEQATITASEGSHTRFVGDADGGTASVHIDQNAGFDASQLHTNQLSLGALTSAGDVNLGRTVLSVKDKIVLNESSKLNLVLGYGQLIANEVELQGGSLELQRAADLLYTLGETYRIIDTDIFSGSNFSSDIKHDFAFVDPILSDDGTGVILERNTVGFASVAETQNQTAVANALDGLETDRLVYRAIISGSKDDARHSFDQLSGEIHASVESAVHENSNQLRLAILERARRSNLVYQPNQEIWNNWLTVTGTVANRNDNGNAASGRFTGYAVTGGIDSAFSNAFSAGIAGNYEQNTLKISDRYSSADVTTVGAGVYAAWSYEGFGLRGGASYQHHAIDTGRTIALPVLTGSLQSDYSAWTGQIFTEAGYRFDAGGLTVEPYGGVSYIRSKFDSFQEYGLTDAALNGASASLQNTVATLGIRMNKRFIINSGLSVDAQFEAAWNRAFGDQHVTRQIAFSSGLPFEISGTGISRDYLFLDARLSLLRSERFDLNVIYSGLLSKETQSHRFGSAATFRF